MLPPNVVVLGHPLILHKLTHMRDKRTSTATFRQLLREISMLMGYEIFRELPLEDVAIETPIGPARAPVIAGRKPAIVPVLRAGQIGRASCRERVCQYGSILVGAVSLKKKKIHKQEHIQ